MITILEQAKNFAQKAHQGQFRKVTKTPYIEHPIRVANRLKHSGASDELIAAAYLHDVVEDTSYKIKDIQETFGNRIATLVTAHTEDKSKSWLERKQETIDLLKNAELEIKYLIVADRLDNLLDLETDLNQLGPDVWNYFNAGFEHQKWYNESIAKNMEYGIDPEDIPSFFNDFKQAVHRIFA